MKKIFILITVFSLYVLTSMAQVDSVARQIKAIESQFTYQHGAIKIGNGIAVINVPPGFKYLDSIQAEKVLTDVWGNPKGTSKSLGFLLPENQGILSEGSYVFNIEYDAIGYVKDNDADDIDYDELMENMKKEAKEESPEREKQGYSSIEMVGWASKPYYDKDRHILHWAKEIKFGNDSINTLNYNVRVLGRKGVLILNAIATMQELPPVKASIPPVLNSVAFSDGNKYNEFDSSIDNVAAWTLGGLVAGKILAKVGFFALLLKFWKLIAIGAVAAFSAIKKFFGFKKAEPAPAEEETRPIAELPHASAEEKAEADPLTDLPETPSYEKKDKEEDDKNKPVS